MFPTSSGGSANFLPIKPNAGNFSPVTPFSPPTNFASNSRFGPPDLSGGLDFNSLASQLMGFIANEHEKDRQMQQYQLSQALTTHLRDQAAAQEKSSPANQQKNVVFGGTIPSPLEPFGGLNEKDKVNAELKAAGLGLKSEDMFNKNTLAQQKLTQTGQIAADKNTISQGRASAYEYSKLHPNHIILKNKGGNLQAYDPATDKVTTLMDSQGNPIDSGTMTDEDAINLKAMNAEELEGMKANTRQNLLTQRGQQELTNINARGDQTRQTQAMKPPSSYLEKIRQINAAHEYINTHPGADKFITFDQTGYPQVSTPGTFSSFKQSDVDDANKAIYNITPQQSYQPNTPKILSITPKGGGDEEDQ